MDDEVVRENHRFPVVPNQNQPASPGLAPGVHTTVRPLSPSLGEPGVCLRRLSNRSIAYRWIAECQWHQKPNIGFLDSRLLAPFPHPSSSYCLATSPSILYCVFSSRMVNNQLYMRAYSSPPFPAQQPTSPSRPEHALSITCLLPTPDLVHRPSSIAHRPSA